MKDFLLWKNAKTLFYASSIASTWIWAPAIFVSSEKAYYSGISGFLMFLVPNVLTLIFFAYFANIVRSRVDGFTLVDAVERVDNRQKKLHLFVSCVVLVCSTCVQMLGLYALFATWFDVGKWLVAFVVSALALIMVGKTGIKGSIKTDAAKYVIMFLAGLILMLNTGLNNDFNIRLDGVGNVSVLDTWKTFGISTMIGLLCAPYVDQTFWQRVFSIDKGKIVPTFLISSILFALIPIMFGMIGFMQTTTNTSWSIGNAFVGGPLNLLLAFCVLSALLSTLDSNLCAISSIAIKEFNTSVNGGRLCMIALLLFSSLLMITTNVTITEMFLIYGTIRTCVALPTILAIIGKYDKQRLFYATLLCVIVAPVGYLLSNDAKWLFTLLALIIPVLGFARS